MVRMDFRGAKELYHATNNNIGKPLLLVLDDKIVGVKHITTFNTGGSIRFEVDDIEEKHIAKIKNKINVSRD